MPTFLVTSKMDPALAERIQQSLRGDGASRQRRPGRRIPLRALVQLALAVAIVSLGVFLLGSYRQSRTEVELARRQLSQKFHQLERLYSPTQQQRIRRLTGLLLEASQKDLPERIAPQLSGPGDLASLLEKPALYLRASAPDLQTDRLLKETAQSAELDAFYVCLRAQPESESETVLLRTLGSANGHLSDGSVFGFGTVLELEDFLNSDFLDDVTRAEHMSELVKLESHLERKNLKRKAEALTAENLIYVIDEPLQSGQKSDFDGEGPHAIRLGIVAIESGIPLLRLRREVSPEWISEKSRLSFSRPLDSCKLAYELYQELGSNKAEPLPDAKLPNAKLPNAK